MKSFLFTTLFFLIVISGLWTGWRYSHAQQLKHVQAQQFILSAHTENLTQRILLYRELLLKQNELELIDHISTSLQATDSLPSDSTLPESSQIVVNKHLNLIIEEKTFFQKATETKSISTRGLAELVAKQTNLLREFEKELESIESP